MSKKYKIALLDVDRLREVLTYDPETGVFTWLKTIGPKGMKGTRAGGLTSRGYRRIGIDGKQYYEHDLAWLFHYGTIPDAELDHKNLRKGENWIDNLREATRSQNAMNQRVNARSTSGLKGAAKFYNPGNRANFRSAIRFNGKRIFLGLFHTAEEAHAAYAKKARELHGEFANTD